MTLRGRRQYRSRHELATWLKSCPCLSVMPRPTIAACMGRTGSGSFPLLVLSLGVLGQKEEEGDEETTNFGSLFVLLYFIVLCVIHDGINTGLFLSLL